MEINIFPFILLVLGIYIYYLYIPLNEGLTILPTDQITKRQQQYNPFMKLINPSNPALQLDGNTGTKIAGTILYNKPGYSGEFENTGIKQYMSAPTSPELLQLAQQCEKVKTTDCNAFSDPQFAKNCGLSFDKKGKNSAGQAHMGGLLYTQLSRESQEGSTSPAPTLGASSQFVGDMKSCTATKEQLDCTSKHSFKVPNCTQCLTSSEWNRLDPTTTKISVSFVFQGTANSVSIQTSKTGTTNVSINSSTPTTVNIPSPGISEGETYNILVSGDMGNTSISGYITANTAKGVFNMDINGLIDIDLITNYKQSISGTQVINNVTCFILQPGAGKSSMNLRGHMPFSFINPYDSNASICDNGPIMTTTNSVNFLQSSDPCYGSSSVPGKYSINCLQQLFTQMGGLTSGTGYPKDQITANALLFNTEGEPNDLYDIGNYLQDMNIRSSTGRDQQGNTLSTEDWNTASMFCTGIPITNPCGSGNKTTSISRECMTYLYQNKGATDPTIGPTYSLGQNYSNLLNNNTNYCRPEGTLNPSTDAGFALTQKADSISAIKQIYNTAHKIANDNTLTNQQRSQAMQQCYGTTIVTNPAIDKEVFYIDPVPPNNGSNPSLQISDICSKYNAVPATTAQLQQSQKYGADWCKPGWVGDSSDAQYPITSSTTCMGKNQIGVFTSNNTSPSLTGFNCYGIKPPKGTPNIYPFNQNKWNIDKNLQLVSGNSSANNIYNEPVDSVHTCNYRCQANPSCKVASFQMFPDKSSGVCWYKSATDPLIPTQYNTIMTKP